MKIAVYAICKDEEAYIHNWHRSVSWADEVVVVDTGSKDSSKHLLESLGIKVYSANINPWRFDTARNLALNLISSDIDFCLSLDLDEQVVLDIKSLVETELCSADRAIFLLNDLNSNNLAQVTRLHRRHGYTWWYRCHEIIKPTFNNEHVITISQTAIEHQASIKPRREMYLSLLEQDYIEFPEDPRVCYYLARQLMFSNINKSLHLLQIAKQDPIRTYEAILLEAKLQEYLDKSQALTILKNLAEQVPARREAWLELYRITKQQGTNSLAEHYKNIANTCNSKIGLETANHYWQ